MEAYQQRVVDEKAELDERIERLHIFCNSERFQMVHPDKQTRLLKQINIMHQYSEILQERIDAF